METSEVSGDVVMEVKDKTTLGRGRDKRLLEREWREVMSNYTSFSSTLNGRASDIEYYAVKGRTGYFTFLVGLARLARPARAAVEAGWD